MFNSPEHSSYCTHLLYQEAVLLAHKARFCTILTTNVYDFVTKHYETGLCNARAVFSVRYKLTY